MNRKTPHVSDAGCGDSWSCGLGPGLQVAATILFEFEGFEEGLEVPLAEALASLAGDDLEKEGGAVLQRLGEALTTSVPGPCIEIFTDLSADLSAVYCTA